MIFVEICCSLNRESSLEVELEDEKLVKYEYLGLVSLDLLLTFKYEDNVILVVVTANVCVVILNRVFSIV